MLSKRPKRYYKRDQKKRQVIAKKPRPQRSLYDGDAYVKVQWRWQLLSAASGVASYLQMRTDLATSAVPNFTWLDAAEYQPFFPLYQLCEVRGMKMDVTIGQFNSTGNKIIHSAVIYAGPSAGVPTGSTPDDNRSQGMMSQKVCNLQGQVTSLYFDVNRALRNAGMPQSTQRTTAYPTDYGYCMYVLLA